MKLARRPKVRGSAPLGQGIRKAWKPSRIVRLRWLFPLIMLAIPLAILLTLTLFLLLLLLGFMFYIASSRPLLRSRRGDRMIEAEYWIEPKDRL